MNSPRELAERLAALEQAVFSGRVGQLGHSSFEGGGINQYSSDGTSLVSRYGVQFDGTGGVAQFNGPPPPTPSWTGVDPAVEPGLRAFKVRWGGEWEPDGTGVPVVAPVNYTHMEVHASTDADFTGLFFETLRSTIGSARGGEVIVPTEPGQQYWFRLVARNSAGQKSIPSVPIGPFTALDVADFGAGTTVFYGPSEPTTTHPDLWMKEVDAGPPPQYILHRYDPALADWIEVQDQGVADAALLAEAAQAAADQRARLFAQDTQPVVGTDFAATDKVIWLDTNDENRSYTWDGVAFQPRLIGNSAIEPQSLVASDVLVTGTVNAALLEAIMVLTTEIVLGNPAGTHARLTPTGIHGFKEDIDDGVPDEVLRLATDTNDYFGITDSAGGLVSSIDDTGRASHRVVEAVDDLLLAGTSMRDLLGRASGGGGPNSPFPGARHWIGWNSAATINGVTAETGLIELEIEVEPDRLYWICPAVYFTAAATTAFLTMRVRDGGTGVPSLTSPLLFEDFFSSGNNAAWTLPAERHRPWRFATGGTHRLLLSVAGTSGAVNIVNNLSPMLTVVDLGPDYGNPASVNRGGGGTPSPTKQSYALLAPTEWKSYRGDGTIRNSVAGPIQGRDPANANGDQSGYWKFNIPNITGTVDRVEFYSYSTHWYYNSGGTARFNMIKPAVAFPVSSYKIAGSDLVVGGFPKPGSRNIVLPSDWWHNFETGNGANQAVGISVGPTGTTDLTYYGKFDGPSARLRIWYTQ